MKDFVLVPAYATGRICSKIATADLEDVGNCREDAALELWDDILQEVSEEVPLLRFSRPVFHAGRNVTVRRGAKWFREEWAYVDIGEDKEPMLLKIGTDLRPFFLLSPVLLADEHDPSCRTLDGLFSEMQRVYPGFERHEDVTVVSFYLPAYGTAE
jgi:hypothetical protein